MNKKYLLKIRRTAAELLARAASVCFPSWKRVSGGYSDCGFYFDFIFKDKPDLSQLAILDERMHLLVGENIEIKSFKMILKNAKEYLISRHEDSLATTIERGDLSEKSLVGIVEIGNYLNLVEEEEELITSSGEIKFFKLYGSDQIDKEVSIFRIFGALFLNMQELRDYLKLQKRYGEVNHIELGMGSNLFLPLEDKYSTKYIWQEKGVILKNIISSFLKKRLNNEGFIEVQLPESIDDDKGFGHLADSREIGALQKESLKKIVNERKGRPFYVFEEKHISRPVDKLFFGIYRSLKKNIIDEYIICLQQFLLTEIISSLNFIAKMLKIYRFNSYTIICRNFAKKSSFKVKLNNQPNVLDVLEEALARCKLKYVVEDGFVSNEAALLEFLLEDGQKWLHKGPYLIIDFLDRNRQRGQEKSFVVKRSSIGEIDDFIALLIEKEEGALPLWLNPEQVRIICLDNCLQYALEIKSLCDKENIRAFIDNTAGALKTKVHLAIKERVGFIVVVGEKEVHKRCVTLRKIGEDEMKQMSIDSFVEKLQDIQKIKEQEVGN